MQSSLILSLTITCFTLAPRLTLIYSTTFSAEGQKIKIQSASVVPDCLLPILYFCFSYVPHDHTKFSSFLLYKYLNIHFFLLNSSSYSFTRLAPVWIQPDLPFCWEGTALYPYINHTAPAFAVPICCVIPINNVWQRAAWDNPWPAPLTSWKRETRQKQTTPLDTRTQSNLVQRGRNKAFHFSVF